MTLIDRLREKVRNCVRVAATYPEGYYRRVELVAEAAKYRREIAAIRRARARRGAGDWREDAFAALCDECDARDMPQYFVGDVSEHDRARLFSLSAAAPIPFVWAIRPCGSHMGLANGERTELEWVRGTEDAFGAALWYWYDPRTARLEAVPYAEAMERLEATVTTQLNYAQTRFFRRETCILY